MAVLALAFSPVTSHCPCALAASPAEQSCCAPAEEPACCCGDQCGVTDAGCCCSTADESTGSESECQCSVRANEPQAPAPASPTRVVDGDAGTFLLPAPTPAINSGINGAAWATAFDREAPGGPPGMQLHAYFSVWQI
jgi:hypothetical protein